MSWIENFSFEYRANEIIYVDLPSIFQYCLPALVQEFARLCLTLFLVNALYQLIITDVILKDRPNVKHILSSILGALVLLYFYPLKSVLFILFLLISIYSIFIQRTFGLFVIPIISAIILGCLQEWWELELRPMQGPLMIIIMKLIWVWMEGEEGIHNHIDGLPIFLHYCLSPTSIVFGPIVPFDQFRAKIFQPRLQYPFGATLKLIIITFATFIGANCICQSVDLVAQSEYTPYHMRFLQAYKDALEFRLSHYFVCFLSTFQMTVGTPALAEPVVNFWAIETPTSMRSVVRQWNSPMHHFLKKYVFTKLRSSFGNAFAIVVTFVISASLHMFDIRVTVVLCGLSLICVIESRLDSHLPRTVSDIWFRITTFVHLVYFGCIMMGQEEDETFFAFVMDRWLQLNFISLKIIIVECIFCAILELRRLIRSKSEK